MLSREELLLRKAWAFTAYKEGRIPESRYKQLLEEVDLQLNNKVIPNDKIMKKMFHNFRKDFTHS